MLFFIGLILISNAFSASFIQAPQVSVQNGKATITFSVDVSTDVEVAILDAGGKVVRHLAAGVLGGQYDPPPPLQPGLSQTLEWNGLDDYGHPPLSGPFNLRVRLGVKPEFERTISTRVFPSGNWMWGPDNVDPQGDYLDTQHPLFQDPDLYEEEPKLNITVSDETDELLVKVSRDYYYQVDLARFDGIAGTFNGIRTLIDKAHDLSNGYVHWGESVFDWFGAYIYHCDASGAGRIYRFTKDFTPAVFSTTGTNHVTGFVRTDQYTQGTAGGPDSSIYVIHYVNESVGCPLCTEPSKSYSSVFAVSKISKDGAVKPKIIRITSTVNGGVRVDLQGNIYVATRVKPLNQPVPSFVNAASLTGAYDVRNTQKYWAEEMYGSILKFDSTGGRVYLDPSGNLTGNTCGWRHNPDAYRATGEGIIWMYYGYSHVLSHNSMNTMHDYNGASCECNGTRFDVDRYGRIFFPNTFQYEFAAIDNNRNEIFRMKNRDIPGAAIGLGHQIEVTDRAMYVADHFNNQVHFFKLVSEKEATLALPSLGLESRAGSQTAGISIRNYPNPFSSMTKIAVSFQLSVISKVNLEIFNIHGKLVKRLNTDSRQLMAGVTWSGAHLRSGIYYCRLTYGKNVKTHTMILIR